MGCMLYAIGGTNLKSHSSVGEIFDVNSSAWKTLPPVPIFNMRALAATAKDRLYLFRFRKSNECLIAQLDLEKSRKWAKLSIEHFRFLPELTASVANLIFLAGRQTMDLRCLDIEAGSWNTSNVRSLPCGNVWGSILGMTASGGELYIVGSDGRGGGFASVFT